MRWLVVLLVLFVTCSGCSTTLPKPSPNYTSIWGYEPSEVVIAPKVSKEIAELYRTVTIEEGHEFALCLNFDIITSPNAFWKGWGERAYYVYDVDSPTDEERGDGFVFYTCEERGVLAAASLHSHPIRAVNGVTSVTCQRSPTDRKTFWRSSLLFHVVWCSPTSFRWYTRNGEQGGTDQGEISWTEPYIP